MLHFFLFFLFFFLFLGTTFAHAGAGADQRASFTRASPPQRMQNVARPTAGSVGHA